MIEQGTLKTSRGPDEAFAAHLEQGRFMLQRCQCCESYVFYPRVLCPKCGQPRLQWEIASGLATVYSVTTVRRKPEKGGDYNVVLVDLDEGPRMMSRIDAVLPEDVRIGMRVKAKIVLGGDGNLIVFTPQSQNSV